MIDPETGAPSDYAELYVHYADYVKRWLRKVPGIPAQDVDDVAMEVLAKFLERGELEKYDPNYTVDSLASGRQRVPGERFRKVRFASYLRGFVLTYAQNPRDRLTRHARRELGVLDAPVTADGLTWAQTLAETPDEDPYETMTTGMDCANVIEVAFGRFEEMGTNRWTMPQAFRACADSMEEYGYVRYSYVAQALGVSQSAVHRIMEKMRAVLSECGADEILGAG